MSDIVKEAAKKSGGMGVIGKIAVPLTLFSEYHTTGKEYGQGVALMKSALYLAPSAALGLGVLAVEIGKAAGDVAYASQQSKRKSSFATASFKDPYGNSATMRQRSRDTLQRGRSSLGSEARLFH